MATGRRIILWRNPATGAVYVALMNGTMVSSYKYVDTIVGPWVVAGVGDFDSDGQPDLLWREHGTGDVTWGNEWTDIVTYRYIDECWPAFEIDAVAEPKTTTEPATLSGAIDHGAVTGP